MNFATIQEGIRVAVRDALGLSDTNADARPCHAVVWEKSKEAGTFRPNPRVDLKLRMPAGLGTDEIRQTYNAGTDAIEQEHCGIRMLPVEIRIESETQVPGASESVGGLANKLRTRLYWQGPLATLKAAGVALNIVRATNEAEYTREGRKISVSITEILFSAGESDIDTSPGAGDYIERVTVKSYDGATPTLLGEGGEPTPVQVDTTIPPEE